MPPVEETYRKVNPIEHVLLRPDTYVGSCEMTPLSTWDVDESGGMRQRQMSIVPGLFKIFDEILVNANDHKVRDPSMKQLRVSIDVAENRITVENDGKGIPIEMHKTEGVWVPELIFGHLLTSSNYDDNEKKVTGGRNGYGAKLANIFSKKFVLKTSDGEKTYVQTFRNNMTVIESPVIKTKPSKKTATVITFYPDLSKFGLETLDGDTVSLMRRRVYDVAGNIGKTTNVFLNNEQIPIKGFIDYVDMYLGKDGEAVPRAIAKTARWEVCVALSDAGQFQQCSFVNGVCTSRGGTHVNHVADAVVKQLTERIKKREKSCKSIKPVHVKSHLWVFVNALIENPAFDSQTKETLTTTASKFGSSFLPPEALLKKLMSTNLVERISTLANSRESKELKKQDGKKRGRLTGIPKLDDANDAGGRHSEHCTLILTEGDSAKALAVSGLSVVGRDRYGVFPLRGKLLNVRDASVAQISNNAEINNIKQILGLKHGLEYDSAKSLRYGHLMIMTDQDNDGSHIKGLIINFLHHHFPSLLKIPGFLVEFITPIVKATKKKETRVFYTVPEYDNFKEYAAAEGGWRIKYYKGLGTSTTAEAKEYFAALDQHRKTFVSKRDADDDLIDMAFSKKRAEDRKTWMNSYEAGTFLDMSGREVRYDDFINKELVLFSRADLQRSIPSVVDGLKTSQRKVLFACLKRKLIQDIKVAQLSGYVSEHAAYHHGEASLATTIVGLAQDFVGSNNANILVPSGQFGTRLQGGKDHASPRYIFTRLAPVCRALFPEADDPLLDYLDDDGLSIEPSHYLPVVPLVLVNGAEGIGTGWSTSIPNYNAADVIANVRRHLAGEPVVEMHPWYRGFRGTVELSGEVRANSTVTSKKYTVKGKYEFRDDGTLVITELPLKTWTSDYKEFIETLMVAKPPKTPLVTDYKEHHTDSAVRFEIKLAPDNGNLNVETVFKLSKQISTTNMHCFDARGAIKKYGTPEEILNAFVPVRLQAYEKRRQVLISVASRELKKISNRARFVTLVISRELSLGEKKKEDVVLELEKFGFDALEDAAHPYDYLLNMPLMSLTRERHAALLNEKAAKEEELEALHQTTAKKLWLADLDHLEAALRETDARDEDNDKDRAKKKKI